MERLWTVKTMCLTWGLPQCMICQVTKNMTPVDYTGFGHRRQGLYRVAEVAAELAQDTEDKLRRARENVINYQDRLRRLSPFLEDD